MKYLLYFLCIFCFNFGIAQEKTYLVLSTNNNSKITLELTDNSTECLEFEDTHIVVNWDMKIDYENLSKIYISDTLPASLIPPKLSENPNISVSNRVLYISTDLGSNIKLFSISGLLLYNIISKYDTNTIDLSMYPAGIYILTINNKSFKFQIL